MALPRLTAVGLWLACLANFFPGLPQARAPQDAGPVTVLSGGNLLDGTGAPARTGIDIFLSGDRISSIVNSGEQRIPRGATVVDVRGKWVLPGLIDSHVHYESWMPELFLYHGVTSVFDLGNETKEILKQRESLHSGKARGPRLFVTGQSLQGPSPTGSPTGAERSPRNMIRSPEDARAQPPDPGVRRRRPASGDGVGTGVQRASANTMTE